MYISTSQELRDFVGGLSDVAVIGIDTEFMRERTYYAKLCLIQMAVADDVAIIDPLTVDDLEPLFALLRDRSVVKVLHAGSQDLEIFYQLMGEVPAPLFDTQLAASLAGFPQQVGYGALLREVLGADIDKADTFTDWSKRPLSETQVAYALNDVRYLVPLYEHLLAGLERDERLQWLESDFERLEDPSTYATVPEEQWRRLKRVSSLKRRQLAVAREMAAWRELEAQRRDVPKRWVLGDESIVEIARRAPTTADEVLAIRGVGDKLQRSAIKGVLAAVQRGLDVPEDELPLLERRRRAPAADIDGAVDLMVALVRLRAREHGVAMPVLASRDDLERLASGERDAHRLLEGWRRDIVGAELLDLLDGRLSLSLDDGVLHVDKR